jgi:HAD superfamily hydrolase (TIGR01509 family)
VIATVTFDAGQTLIELDTAMLAARLGERGVATTATALAAAQPAAWQRYEQLVTAGGHDQPWQVFMAALIVGATGVAADRAAALAAWLWTEQPRRNLWRRPVPGMIELVRELRAAGLAVGVLSNSEGRLAALFAEIGWGDEFAAVIDSGVVGVAKPDPQIFALTLAALGGAPATAVHVGDSRSADIDGARACGWRAIWFGAAAVAHGAGADPGVAVAADAAGVRAALAAWASAPTG